MKTALIIVDIQKDYFQGGRMELVGAIKASEAANRLIAAFRQKALPVIYVQHISNHEGATFFIPGTTGIDFQENVMPLHNETIIQKHFPNSFKETGLRDALKSAGIEELVICGMMSHMCIDATVRAAFDMGYRCIVTHDACATRDLAFNGIDIPAGYVHGAFMVALGPVYAQMKKTDEVIDML